MTNHHNTMTARNVATFLLSPLLVLVLLFSNSRVSWSADYEIPLNDLKKVEKKNTGKSESKKRKERKKSSKVAEQPTKEKDDAKPAKAAENIATTPPLVTTGAGTEQSPQAGLRIQHEPYSFVVPGKSTRITAVISGNESLQSVRCQFKATLAANAEPIPMTKVDGSLFTYRVILPPLAADVQQLQYRFIVTEQNGRVNRSPEYSSPVRATSFVPGWQE